MIDIMKNSSRPIETRWIAITGAPSSGKTALVNTLMRQHGMRTSPDFARRVLEQAKLEGHSVEDFKKNPSYYQNIIVKTRLESVYKEMPYVTLVHDYGLPCYKAWGEINNVATLPELDKACQFYRYAHVFLLEPLTIKQDDIRIGNDDLHIKFLKKLEKTYRLYDYEPVIVPRFSGNKNRSNLLRAQFILDYLIRNKQQAAQESLNTIMPIRQKA